MNSQVHALYIVTHIKHISHNRSGLAAQHETYILYMQQVKVDAKWLKEES